jgi:hypothetical protein
MTWQLSPSQTAAEEVEGIIIRRRMKYLIMSSLVGLDGKSFSFQ